MHKAAVAANINAGRSKQQQAFSGCNTVRQAPPRPNCSCSKLSVASTLCAKHRRAPRLQSTQPSHQSFDSCPSCSLTFFYQQRRTSALLQRYRHPLAKFPKFLILEGQVPPLRDSESSKWVWKRLEQVCRQNPQPYPSDVRANGQPNILLQSSFSALRALAKATSQCLSSCATCNSQHPQQNWHVKPGLA